MRIIHAQNLVKCYRQGSQQVEALRGVSLLIITHDPRIATSCPRRLRLQAGKIVTEEQE